MSSQRKRMAQGCFRTSGLRLALTMLILQAATTCERARAAPGNFPLDASESSFDTPDSESAKGHGWFSIGYLNSLGDGLRISDGNILRHGHVRIRSLMLSGEYFFSDYWAMHAGIPFVSNRYQGRGPHCPTSQPPACANIPALDPQHPESQFLDDGDFHGTWQDWFLGVSYHGNIGKTLLTPSLTISAPSHTYTFFAHSAVGQRLWKVEPAVDIAHQFEFSNVYYRIHYGYVFVEKTLGTSVDHHRLDLELGYFINPEVSLRVFTLGKIGDGYKFATLFPLSNGATNELFYRHDQVAAHNYATAGFGVDWRLGERYVLSASAQRLIWGQSVFNFQYSLDVRLTRSF